MADLDSYGFSSYEGFNGRLVHWRYELLSQFFTGHNCLELGSSDGRGTEHLLNNFAKVVAVDGSRRATESLRSRFANFPGLAVIEALFDTLSLSDRFDTVIAAHVLEHVDDPQALLAVARRHLAPDGVLIIDVPNALSLHRRLGVRLGMLSSPEALNDADRSIGHQRVYTPASFRQELVRAGFEIVHTGGVYLKILSNNQMELFSDDLHEGFLGLGSDLPELAAEIYAVARLPS